MNSNSLKLTVLCMASFLALAARTQADQACASNVAGGVTSPGSYAGIGATCAEARQDLQNSFGFSLPTCEPCQGPGCNPGAHFDDPSGVSMGNCNWDAALGAYVVAASVSSPSSWYKSCSPCLQVN